MMKLHLHDKNNYIQIKKKKNQYLLSFTLMLNYEPVRRVMLSFAPSEPAT